MKQSQYLNDALYNLIIIIPFMKQSQYLNERLYEDSSPEQKLPIAYSLMQESMNLNIKKNSEEFYSQKVGR